MQRISVRGIRCYSYHGCLEEEGKIGGNYIVHVALETDFTDAAISDDLSRTVDYCDVARIAREEMAIRSKLIEQAGYRIIRRLFLELDNAVSWIEVEVIKLSPPIPGEIESVSISLSGRKEEFAG